MSAGTPHHPASDAHLWSAKDSSFSKLSVPAEANMMVVSRSAMIPDTALAAVMHAWVPLLPAWRAESTKDTWDRQHTIHLTGDRLHFHMRPCCRLLCSRMAGDLGTLRVSQV